MKTPTIVAAARNQIRRVPRRKSSTGSISVNSDPNTGTSPWYELQSCGTNEKVTAAFRLSQSRCERLPCGTQAAAATPASRLKPGQYGVDGRYLCSSGNSGSPCQSRFLSQWHEVRTTTIASAAA